MHLTLRAYALLLLAAAMALAAIWSAEPLLGMAWRLTAAVLLAGLAAEGIWAARVRLQVEAQAPTRLWLGRPQPAALAFHNDAAQTLTVTYAPVLPEGCEPLSGLRRVTAEPGAVTRDGFTLLPGSLGPHPWRPMPARLRGPLRLAWWSRELAPAGTLRVVPDTLRAPRIRPGGEAGGVRARLVAGAGSELLQLRRYVPGDPPARIDWKASARARNLVTRELSDDQHLDVVLAIDASRYARARCGALERLGAYANIAARLAQVVTANDDRIGIIVYADTVLAARPAQGGRRGVMQVRHCLGRTSAAAAEPDPVGAALSIRALQRHRSCVVLLTELEDASLGEPLAQAVRLLSPPHLVVLAGVRDAQLEELAQAPAREAADAWIALAAQAQLQAARAQRARLARLGAPVVHERPGRLEAAVFASYARLRRTRRI